MERELALEFVRVTEMAALSSGRWMGRGDKMAADGAAVKAMRTLFDTVAIEGTIVIGEGEMDEAPMLYIGEKVGMGAGKGYRKVDIAVDPLEGTNLVAKGLNGSIAVLAVGEENCLLHAPDMYMNKICVGPQAKGAIDIDAPVKENLKNVAAALNKNIADLTVVILDRERHEKLIKECREAGARIKLISDGDVSPAVATGFDDSGIDMVIGIGGAPEGVLAAAALKCLGGDMQARLVFENDVELERSQKMGLKDPKQLLRMDDLVRGDDVIFAATGITDSYFLKGVLYEGERAKTYSIVMRAKTGTVRYIEATHCLDRKEILAQLHIMD